jgi:multiple sugar transport system substrate-binding protein
MRIRILVCACIAMLAFSSLSAQKTEIKYAFWGNPDAIGVEKDIIDAYQAAHTDVTVTPIAVDYTNYHAKLLTMIAGGQPPDVMRIDSFFFQDFMSAKALKDITPLIKQDKLDLSKYYPAGLGDCRSGDKYYGLPWGTAPNFMILNVKMFQDAGIALPQMSWKWGDFVDIARKLAKGEGDTKQYGFIQSLYGLDFVLPFLWMEGQELFDATRTKFALNTPETAKKIEELKALVKDGVSTSPFELTASDAALRYFSQGRVAMMIGQASTILSLQKIEGVDFAIRPIPGTAKYPAVTTYKSNIVGISAGSKKEKAAWEFLKFLRGPSLEGETLYMKAKRIPPTFDDEKLWSLYADATKPPKDIVPICKEIAAKYGHLLPLRKGWLEVQTLYLQAMQKVFADEATASAALAEVAPKIQAVLDKK